MIVRDGNTHPSRSFLYRRPEDGDRGPVSRTVRRTVRSVEADHRMEVDLTASRIFGDLGIRQAQSPAQLRPSDPQMASEDGRKCPE
ncbi:hypothetical protein GCM10023194_74170 [Planotetraspora phitsanulokensis]|uniref:Uncharacterized protein n=1 Tax=Planotetraspora phitsanulokensis TaxID=575192 RepID=A0A8J3XDX1_9ACTN|nr:hypothetical protein Pph01_20870 [Planotetraspora phitsanulokensis]